MKINANRFEIFEAYEQVFHQHDNDEKRFKAVQEKTGATIQRIRQVVCDAHEEGRE